MISPQRQRGHRENPQFMAGDGPAPAPCTPCLSSEDSCETKPIRGEGGRDVGCCTNKANLSGQGPGDRGVGRTRETNPISWRGRVALPRPSTLRPRPRQTDCAKQTQSAPQQCEGQVLHGQRFMVNWTCTERRRNKANSRPCRAGRPLGGMGGTCETNPISRRCRAALPCPSGRAPAKPIMPNKPNLHRSDLKGKSFMGKELW